VLIYGCLLEKKRQQLLFLVPRRATQKVNYENIF
jgi:hypothetical protein